MNKQHTHEMKSLRKKLFAAVAMLLVACVMTVSSTYAWFTLSTAPEVKGITTTVGANGNLEIALGTYNTVYGSGIPSSGENNSMYKPGNTAQNANVTWGNLIDVTTGYGLENITLYPTRLNSTDGISLSNSSPLLFAKYGADGRVTDLGTAIKGGWSGSSFTYEQGNPSAGVNGIGSSSEISERALALINYKNAYVREMNAALTAAQDSINVYGSDLASLMVQHVNAGDNDTIDYFEYKDSLTGLITKLEASNNAIGNTVKNAILAFLASEGATANGAAITDDAWKSLDEVISVQSVEDLVTTIGSVYNVPSTLISDYFTDTYVNAKGKINSAKTALDTMTADNDGWDVVQTIVQDLVDTSKLLIMDMTIDQVKNDPDDVVNMLLQGKGIYVSFGYNNDKVYSIIADMVGEFNGSIKFVDGTEISALGQTVNLSNVQTSLTVEAGAVGATFNLTTLKGDVLGYQAPASTAQVQGLVDMYGYTLDLLFRTNAADSKLLLQTAPINRVYGDEEVANQDLMGGGSNMVFNTSAKFQADQVKALMGAIRIVFYTTPEAEGEGKIIGVAKLNTAAATVTGNQVKANLQLVDKATAYSANGVFNTSAALATADANGNYELTALTANVAQRVSVLVYLDGDVVDNTMVSAYASVAGMLNLQFSSTAALEPMDNQGLKDGTK